MTDTLEAELPEAAIEVQEKTVAQRQQDLIDQRIAKLQPEEESEPEAPETEDEEEPEVETPEADEEEEPESEEESEDEVPSQSEAFDLEDMSEEEQKDLAIQLGSKLGKKFAKQRVESKKQDEKITSLEAQIEELSTNVVSSTNPNAALRTTDSVDKAIDQVEVNIKGWNRKLIAEQVEEYDEATGQDVKGVKFGDKFIKVVDLLDHIDAEEEKLKPLRQRKTEIEKIAESIGNEEEYAEEVRGKLDIEDDSDEAKEYDAFLKSPKFQTLKLLQPEFAKELIELAGRAVKQTIPKAKVGTKKIKRKAPKAKNEGVNLNTKAGRKPVQSNDKSPELKRLNKIVDDSTQPIRARQEARLAIRLLNQ
jgi:hypothetical protein